MISITAALILWLNLAVLSMHHHSHARVNEKCHLWSLQTWGSAFHSNSQTLAQEHAPKTTLPLRSTSSRLSMCLAFYTSFHVLWSIINQLQLVVLVLSVSVVRLHCSRFLALTDAYWFCVSVPLVKHAFSSVTPQMPSPENTSPQCKWQIFLLSFEFFTFQRLHWCNAWL